MCAKVMIYTQNNAVLSCGDTHLQIWTHVPEAGYMRPKSSDQILIQGLNWTYSYDVLKGHFKLPLKQCLLFKVIVPLIKPGYFRCWISLMVAALLKSILNCICICILTIHGCFGCIMVEQQPQYMDFSKSILTPMYSLVPCSLPSFLPTVPTSQHLLSFLSSHFSFGRSPEAVTRDGMRPHLKRYWKLKSSHVQTFTQFTRSFTLSWRSVMWFK